MNVAKIIEEVRSQFPEICVNIKLSSIPKKSIIHNKGVVLNKEAGTFLKEVRVNLQYTTPIVSVCLLHTNCIHWNPGRLIRSVPYFCKFCGNQPLTEDNAADLGLPIKAAAAKMQVQVMGLGGSWYARKELRFEVSNMLLYEDAWWHKCPKGPVNPRVTSRLTIKKFPHKCKNCKMLLGDASFNVNAAFKLPGLV